MNNATLTYVIKSSDEIKRLRLESESLFVVDRITSNYKNEKDFIDHYYNKEFLILLSLNPFLAVPSVLCEMGCEFVIISKIAPATFIRH